MRKAIYLIRHGESSFNQISDATERDPFHYDASLTKLGVRQAENLCRRAASIKPQLIVTSPLSRAIQTALHGFGQFPIKVHPAHREWLRSSCDVGRSPRMLKLFYPMLSFKGLKENWWNPNNKPGSIPVELVA